MKTTRSHLLRSLAAAVILASIAAVSHAQTIIFADDFEGQTTSPKTRPDGAFVGDSATYKWHGGWANNASGSTITVDSYFEAANAGYSGSKLLYSYIVANNYTSYYVDANLNSYENYDLTIGYLRIINQGGSVSLNARGTYTIGTATNGGYRITFQGSNTYQISYYDVDTNIASIIGTISGSAALNDISIQVRGNTQTLYVGTTAYTAEGVVTTTQGIYDDATPDYFSMIFRAGSGSAVGIRIDDIAVTAVTAVPEPTTTALVIGFGAIILFGIRYSKRR